MAYSFLTLAKDVLEKENIPLSIEQVSKRPAKFFLKGKTAGLKEYEEKQKQEKVLQKHKFGERTLHILLSGFVNADEHFKCATKTIYEGSGTALYGSKKI